MNFEDEHKRLIDKLNKVPGLKALLESSEVDEHLISDDPAERTILPYGGHPIRKNEEWKMTYSA